MALHVWLSIQSDFGLTMAELGGLSSSTDPKLIASTLMALKDIVSLEATAQGESQFMTGSVENSSYGTFSISITESNKLVLSYIVSADKGVVDQKFVDLITDLLLNIGKQITQFGQIVDIVNSGAVLPRIILIQAYMNACTILRTERKLDIKPRLLKEAYRDSTSEVMSNNEIILQVIEEVLGDNWNKNNSLWLEEGILKSGPREKLIRALADYAVYLIANKQPDLLLHSPNPRGEQNIIYDKIRGMITERVSGTSAKITELIEKEMEGKVENFVKKIDLVDLHKVERELQREFIRRAYVKLVKKDPLQLLVAPDTEPMVEEFSRLVPEINLDHAGTFLYEGIKDEVPEIGRKFIKAFFDGFIEGLGSTTLSQTAMDMMVAFSQSFVDSKELASKIKELDGIEKRWSRDLARFIKSKTVTNLQVDSIEEAVFLSNAAANAIVSALTKIVTDNFFIIDDRVGDSITNLITIYNQNGKSIKIADTLFQFFNILGGLSFSASLISPTYKDFIFSNIVEGGLKISYKDEAFSYNRKKNAMINKKNNIPLYEFMDSCDILTITSGRETTINLEKLHLDHYIDKMRDPNNLIKACIFAARRRYKENIRFVYDKWKSDAKNNLEKFQSKVDGGISLQQFSTIDINAPSYSAFSSLQLGDDISDLMADIGEMVSKSFGNITKELSRAKSEAVKKGNAPKKLNKSLERVISQSLKDLDKFDDKLAIDFDKLIVKIEKELNAKMTDFKKLIQPSVGDVLKYNYSGGNFLPQLKQIRPSLDVYMEQTEGIETEDINQLIQSITLSLYKNPPDAVFEASWNEIISGKRSKNLKKILNKVKTKKEFERRLKVGGEAVANRLYSDLSGIIDLVNSKFVDSDGIVSAEAGSLNLNLGKLPISNFPKTDVITDLMKIKGIKSIRETTSWRIALDFTADYDFSYDDPAIVTFSDGIRYLQRKVFEKNTKNTFDGLTKVASMIEAETGDKINDVFNRLKNAIFNIDVNY